MNKKLYVSVADHGFGHISQSSAVINRLHQLNPNIDVTIQCALDKSALATWFKLPFTHIQHPTEFGMLMDNAIDVKREASMRRYRDFHADWEKHLAVEIKQLTLAKPDLVFANISYLTLAAAQHLAIKNIAMCSLNWAEILKGYMNNCDIDIYQKINSIYNQADFFIQPSPHMPMESLSNRKSIAPLARVGIKSNVKLKQCLQIPNDALLLLIGMGGIPTDLPIDQWPVEHNIFYLIPDSWQSSHPNTRLFCQSNMPFIDMLASCDALITKPGYGSFSEATCNDTPVFYLRRKDWPEEPHLIKWLQKSGHCCEISRRDFFEGNFTAATRMLPKKKGRIPTPEGAQQAAELLLSTLANNNNRQTVTNYVI